MVPLCNCFLSAGNQCNICQKTFRSPKRLTLHLTQSHCSENNSIVVVNNNNNNVKDVLDVTNSAEKMSDEKAKIAEEDNPKSESRGRGRPRMSSGVGKWKNGHACRKCRKHFATADLAATHYR